MVKIATALACATLLAAAAAPAARADASMTFFVTSAGPGDGANLGGLAGADAYCAKLATAGGATAKTWHAYLSTSKENAKDRIGAGPWQNAKGEAIASSVADLHSDSNKLTDRTHRDR